MSPSPHTEATLEQARSDYFDAIMGGHRHEALSVALDLVHGGTSAERVLSEVVAKGQADLGDAWQGARASVTEEHRASAITEEVVQSIVDEALRLPKAPVDSSAGLAVVTCTEDEWHTLPGQMAAAAMRLRGFEVVFIGPSVPANDLAAFLSKETPKAVAVSCMMQLSLTGAWRTISALRAIGTTVVAGGRGFGPFGQWARALGADAVAMDFTVGADMVEEANRHPHKPPRAPVGNPAAITEIHQIRSQLESIVHDALDDCLWRWPALLDQPEATRATMQDLTATLHALASCVLVGDDEVLVDYIHWFEALLAARELPLWFVPSAFDRLHSQLPDTLPIAQEVALRAIALCHADPIE